MSSQMGLRISVAWNLADDLFEDYFKVLEKHKPFDEYVIFTHDAHTPPPLPEMLRRARLLKDRIARLRTLAKTVGINHLCTLGHADEDLVFGEQAHGRLFMDITGHTVPGNLCPRDAQWRKNYVVPVYRALAEANPDVIWIDDDLRMHNHGKPACGCFCDDCFEQLCRLFDFTGTRAEFQASFDDGPGKDPEELRLRRFRLLQWNRSVLTGLVSEIERTVHAVNPDIILGQMDGVNYWEADRAAEADILRGPKNNPVFWRPGGGVYDDYSPDAVLIKAGYLAAINASLPECVTRSESEIESFPYQNITKSRRFTALETSVYCAAGCTGALLNIANSGEFSPVETYVPCMKSLAETKPFNDKIVEMNAGYPLTGIYDGYGKDVMLGCGEISKHWIAEDWLPIGNSGIHNRGMYDIGLPQAYTVQNASCAALTGTGARAMSHDEIMYFLARGMYLDSDALNVLNERGYGEYTGFKTGRGITRDSMEHYLPGEFCPGDFVRNPRQSFWGGVFTEMIPENKEAVMSSELVDYHRNLVAPCVSGFFTNTLGGRIFVSGCAPWNFHGYVPGYSRIHSIFRWISGNMLDAELPDAVLRGAVWSRRRKDGSLAVQVLNSGFDPVCGLRLRLRTTAADLRICRKNLPDIVISPEETADGFSMFRIPELNDLELITAETVQP